MSSRAIKYAEDTLDVHGVYLRADALVKSISRYREDMVIQRKLKRDLESRLTDLEFEIMSDMRGLHSDKSQTALDKLTKEAVHLHAEARRLRGDLVHVAGEMDDIEKAVKSMELDHQTLLARMNELGGYFHYLAATKLGETARTATPAKPAGDWPPDSALPPPAPAPVIS